MVGRPQPGVNSNNNTMQMRVLQFVGHEDGAAALPNPDLHDNLGAQGLNALAQVRMLTVPALEIVFEQVRREAAARIVTSP